MKTKFKLYLVLISAMIFQPLFSEEISGEFIKDSAKKWLNNNGIEENISLLSEIKYPKCDKLVFSTVSLNYTLIKVFCENPNKWSIILRNKILKPKKVKKALKLNNRYKNEVVVLKNDLDKGSVVSPDDIKEIFVNTSINKGIAISKKDVIGKKIKNKILANKVIYLKNLEKNWMIEKNSKVIFENSSEFIKIKVDGIALENGDFNDKIKVKNISSGEILTGFVNNNKKVIFRPKQF